jgi:ectoine hydroxylase-related dioxygenase (phytanoyl-CoA dioxygenase family)
MGVATAVRRRAGIGLRRLRARVASWLAGTEPEAPRLPSGPLFAPRFTEGAAVHGLPPVRSRLGPEQWAQWQEGGYVVLPGFFGPEQLDRIHAEVDALWAGRRQDDAGLVIDVFIDTPDERRMRFRDAPDEARTLPYKLNDLYLVSRAVRETILDAGLVGVLGELLEGPPIVCNSLSFERGSQQRFHFDTFYMPPPVENRMVASWIALEDADDRAGPLRYYPGSHKIAPYRFSDGRLNAVLDEMPDFDDYIDKQIADAGLTWTTFPAKAGDVFVWHAQLYHGGAEIEDMALTRRSLVTHYFRVEDMDPAAVADVGGGRYYLRRAHQAAG